LTPPAPEVVRYQETPDGGVVVLLPRRGLHGAVIRTFFFAAFWMFITVIVSGGFFFGMLKGDVPWLLVFFFVPFYAVGIGLTLWAIWSAWGTTGIRIGPEGAAVSRRLFGKTFDRKFQLADLQRFERQQAYEVNDRPVYAAALQTSGGRVRFGHLLDAPDQKWLVYQLNETLQHLQQGA